MALDFHDLEFETRDPVTNSLATATWSQLLAQLLWKMLSNLWLGKRFLCPGDSLWVSIAIARASSNDPVTKSLVTAAWSQLLAQLVWKMLSNLWLGKRFLCPGDSLWVSIALVGASSNDPVTKAWSQQRGHSSWPSSCGRCCPTSGWESVSYVQAIRFGYPSL